MKETSADDLAGRPIRIVASTLRPYTATIYFDDTSEEIENCQRIELDIDIEKPAILAKVHLLRIDKTRLPDDPYCHEIGETDKVEVNVLAKVEGPTTTCYTSD